jgi:hypothetical protein
VPLLVREDVVIPHKGVMLASQLLAAGCHVEVESVIYVEE